MKILMGESLAYNNITHVGSHTYADFFAADGHDIFWLGGTLHALNLLRAWRGNQHDQQLLEPWQRGGMQLQERFWTYQPFTLLPYRTAPLLNTVTALRYTLNFTVPPVRGILARYGFQDVDLLWIGQSHYSLSLLGQVRYRKLIYRMMDNYAEFNDVPDSMSDAEAEIIARADTVLVTAQKLYEAAREKGGDKVFYLPNGVHYEKFNIPDPKEPADIAALPHPRVLYVGMIADWFDIDLMVHAAQNLPDYNFIIVGPTLISLDRLKGLSNVHLLGARPYDEVPHYMHFSDVGIMPFKKTPLTETINPIKIFEYLATGLPSVSVRLDELERLKSPTLLTETPQDFIDALREAVKRGRGLPEFLAFAEANSWQKRYELIKSRMV
jgi:glycosyltransferase involved in cell wall biosynthesis